MEGVGRFEMKLMPNFLFNKILWENYQVHPKKMDTLKWHEDQGLRHYLFDGIGSVC